MTRRKAPKAKLDEKERLEWEKKAEKQKEQNEQSEQKKKEAAEKREASILNIINVLGERYGQNNVTLASWQGLCRDVGQPEGSSITQCKKVSLQETASLMMELTVQMQSK